MNHLLHNIVQKISELEELAEQLRGYNTDPQNEGELDLEWTTGEIQDWTESLARAKDTLINNHLHQIYNSVEERATVVDLLTGNISHQNVEMQVIPEAEYSIPLEMEEIDLEN